MTAGDAKAPQCSHFGKGLAPRPGGFPVILLWG